MAPAARRRNWTEARRDCAIRPRPFDEWPGERRATRVAIVDTATFQFAACAMTDAEDYTGVAEGMEPQRLVELVNRYFHELFAAVLDNHGIVVDVKGDGILAVWTSQA